MILASILLVLGLIGMLGTVGWILRQGNSNLMTRLFVVCQLSIVLWIISQLLILFSVTDTQLAVSYLIGNLGICIFAPFWLMFAAEYSGISGNFRLPAVVLSILSAAMFGVIASNPFHRLYYAEFGMKNVRYGILFYVFQILFYLLIIAGISLILIRSRRTIRQALLLTLAAAVPLIVNTLTVTGIIHAEIELTPLFFAFSVIMILIAIRRYGLLNVNRIAIRDTINNISSAVAVFDTENHITYVNKAAEKILPVSDSPDIAELYRRLSVENGRDSAEFVMDGVNYNLRKSRCVNKKGVFIANILIITDVSEYYELLNAGKKLFLEQERNRIAQEIHDSAGHTFTMISSLAKIIGAENDIDRIHEYAAEIDGQSRGGITQLRCSINNLRDDSFMTSITRAVETVTTAVRNIRTEVCVQGTEDERYLFCIREIYDTVKETVTNSMRYSGADRIDIILKFLDERLELYIFDNGRGCAEINERGGLSGIRQRIEKIGGTVKFSSAEGDGFSTIIKLGVNN